MAKKENFVIQEIAVKESVPKQKKSKLSLKLSKKAKLIVSLSAAVLLLVCIACVIIFSSSGETSFSIKTSLKEVFDISEFSTAEYTYNSIAKVKIDPKGDETEKNIKFYVSYEGTVKAGFDFKKIDIIETDAKTIIVIPKIEIHCAEPSNFDFIFVKDKYDNETSSMKEALQVCKEDLKNKAEQNKTLQTTAIESAVETVTALTKPFEKHLEEGKTFEIVYIDDYKPEVTK